MGSGRRWACPFFRTDRERGLKCEAGGLSFADAQTWREYTRQYCAAAQGWRGCTLARALLRQYERQEDGK